MTDGEYFLHSFLLLCPELFTDSPGLCFGARLFLGMKTFDKDMRCYRHFIAFRLDPVSYTHLTLPTIDDV